MHLPIRSTLRRDTVASWAPKRFWQDAHVDAAAGGFAVRLDARPLRTPAKAPLIVPTQAMAEAVAAEWRAQSGLVQPDMMPVTRYANSAIDKVVPAFDVVAGLVAAYGATDLLCYRATDQPTLSDRQGALWDPVLDWAVTEFAAPLVVTAGVMPVDQPAQSLAQLSRVVAGMSPFRLAAFHDLVAISGSLLLALAVERRHLSPDAAWAACRIDEDWQAALWGADDEAQETAALREAAFLQAERFLGLCG